LCPNGALEFVDDKDRTPEQQRAFAEKFRDALREAP